MLSQDQEPKICIPEIQASSVGEPDVPTYRRKVWVEISENGKEGKITKNGKWEIILNFGASREV